MNFVGWFFKKDDVVDAHVDSYSHFEGLVYFYAQKRSIKVQPRIQNVDYGFLPWVRQEHTSGTNVLEGTVLTLKVTTALDAL